MRLAGKDHGGLFHDGINEGLCEGVKGVPDLGHLVIGQVWQTQDLPALIKTQHGRRKGPQHLFERRHAPP
jgi:hypothetical protein